EIRADLAKAEAKVKDLPEDASEAARRVAEDRVAGLKKQLAKTPDELAKTKKEKEERGSDPPFPFRPFKKTRHGHPKTPPPRRSPQHPPAVPPPPPKPRAPAQPAPAVAHARHARVPARPQPLRQLLLAQFARLHLDDPRPHRLVRQRPASDVRDVLARGGRRD